MRTPLMALAVAAFGLAGLAQAQEGAKPMLGDGGLDDLGAEVTQMFRAFVDAADESAYRYAALEQHF